jgi:plasmid replication initiation protein
LELEVKEAPPEKQKVLTPEEAIKVAGDSRLAREFNATQPPVEFKVEFVTKAILVKAVPTEGGSEWEKGHGPGDVGLRAKSPADRKQARFLAVLTTNAISQLNKAGITDIEKQFRGRTIRVRGAISWCAYDGLGTPPEVEVVVDDLSHLEVID